MKKLLISVVAIACLGFAASAVSTDQHEAAGVVKKIKSDAKKLTISHGPIKTLGMDGMTMDFAVYDPAMLDEVKEGHQVSFMLEKDKSGNFVIMEIEDKGMAKGGVTSSSSGHEHHHNH